VFLFLCFFFFSFLYQDDTLFSPQEGTIFPCLPRSKVKGLVCGDEVLWIPPSEAGDDATVEKMIERKCDFTRADSTVSTKADISSSHTYSTQLISLIDTTSDR